MWAAEARQTATPTPNPSPQGGGERTECAALFASSSNKDALVAGLLDRVFHLLDRSIEPGERRALRRAAFAGNGARGARGAHELPARAAERVLDRRLLLVVGRRAHALLEVVHGHVEILGGNRDRFVQALDHVVAVLVCAQWCAGRQH